MSMGTIRTPVVSAYADSVEPNKILHQSAEGWRTFSHVRQLKECIDHRLAKKSGNLILEKRISTIANLLVKILSNNLEVYNSFWYQE